MSLTLGDGERRNGQVLEIAGKKAVVQVRRNAIKWGARLNDGSSSTSPSHAHCRCSRVQTALITLPLT